ncbi:hypothetical protein OKW18_006039 [Streptomyces pratensis]|nr:hypothetical protein [Streptomyces pratensis]
MFYSGVNTDTFRPGLTTPFTPSRNRGADDSGKSAHGVRTPITPLDEEPQVHRLRGAD